MTKTVGTNVFMWEFRLMDEKIFIFKIDAWKKKKTFEFYFADQCSWKFVLFNIWWIFDKILEKKRIFVGLQKGWLEIFPSFAIWITFFCKLFQSLKLCSGGWILPHSQCTNISYSGFQVVLKLSVEKRSDWKFFCKMLHFQNNSQRNNVSTEWKWWYCSRWMFRCADDKRSYMPCCQKIFETSLLSFVRQTVDKLNPF